MVRPRRTGKQQDQTHQQDAAKEKESGARRSAPARGADREPQTRQHQDDAEAAPRYVLQWRHRIEATPHLHQTQKVRAIEHASERLRLLRKAH